MKADILYLIIIFPDFVPPNIVPSPKTHNVSRLCQIGVLIEYAREEYKVLFVYQHALRARIPVLSYSINV